MHRERSVDSAVLGVSSTIRGLLIGADRDEVFTRHQVGRILQDVKRRPNAYGEQSIERIAEEVGQSPAMLYRYIAIAEQWSEADIKVEMARENRFGHPPSWSHFVVLLAVADSGIRRQLLKDCLKSSWTVRELRRRVNELSERKLRAADARGAGRPVNAALGEGIQTGNRAAMDVTIFAEALGSRLGDPEEPVDEELLARALQTFTELRERTEATLQQLQIARDSQRRLRCAAPARSGPRFAAVTGDVEDEPKHEAHPDEANRRGKRLPISPRRRLV